ncbi:MAG: cell division protein ZapA [Comamonadaceae bacterium]
MKQLEVQIMGQSYLLGCPDGGDSRLLEAVERVDTAMCKIRDGGKVRARERIAVLAALNLAFDLADQHAAPPKSPAGDLKQSVKSAATTDASAVDSNQLLASLLERLDGALGSDGRLL